MTWPVNYAEQRLYVEGLVERSNVIRSMQQPVLINSLQPPTQNDWESAYVNQTGRRLPILPGTRLLWRNPQTGTMRSFSTAFDLGNGAQTSGNVKSYIGSTYERGAFRLLASMRGGNAPDSVYIKPHSPYSNISNIQVMPPLSSRALLLDLVGEAAHNLSCLFIMGLAFGVTSLDLTFSYGTTPHSRYWANPNKAGSGSRSGDAKGRFTNSGNTVSSADSTAVTRSVATQLSTISLLGGVIFARLSLNGCSFGNGSPSMNNAGLSLQALTSGSANPLAANSQGVEMNNAYRYSVLPIYERLQLSFDAVAGRRSKLWIYGLYENNDQPTEAIR